MDSVNRSRVINDNESIFGAANDDFKDRLSDGSTADEEDLFFSNPKRQFVIFGDKRYAKDFCSNEIQTSKYNFFTFLPLNLLIQFSKGANLYFLTISAL